MDDADKPLTLTERIPANATPEQLFDVFVIPKRQGNFLMSKLKATTQPKLLQFTTYWRTTQLHTW